jgi:hypothetical protein
VNVELIICSLIIVEPLIKLCYWKSLTFENEESTMLKSSTPEASIRPISPEKPPEQNSGDDTFLTLNYSKNKLVTPLT